jgi:hypothetical protein
MVVYKSAAGKDRNKRLAKIRFKFGREIAGCVLSVGVRSGKIVVGYATMRRIFKLKTLAGVAFSGLGFSLLSGCGGGGSGGSSNGGGTPSPIDGTYAATTDPTDEVPSDGRAPTSSLVVTNGRGRAQFTYYLQPSVVAAVQAAVDKGLTDAGFAGDILNNQVPASITFNAIGQVDGSGKLILTQSTSSRRVVGICGTARLTIDSTFANTGTSVAGQGSYNVLFANKLQVRVRGRSESIDGATCNDLPLNEGTIAFTK